MLLSQIQNKISMRSLDQGPEVPSMKFVITWVRKKARQEGVAPPSKLIISESVSGLERKL